MKQRMMQSGSVYLGGELMLIKLLAVFQLRKLDTDKSCGSAL
jgi:hypothetical protein